MHFSVLFYARILSFFLFDNILFIVASPCTLRIFIRLLLVLRLNCNRRHWLVTGVRFWCAHLAFIIKSNVNVFICVMWIELDARGGKECNFWFRLCALENNFSVFYVCDFEEVAILFGTNLLCEYMQLEQMTLRMPTLHLYKWQAYVNTPKWLNFTSNFLSDFHLFCVCNLKINSHRSSRLINN